MTDKSTKHSDATLIRPAKKDAAKTQVRSEEKTAIRPPAEGNAQPETSQPNSTISIAQTGMIENDETVIGDSPSPNRAQLNVASPSTQSRGRTNYTKTRNPLTNTLHDPFSVGGDAIKERFIIKKVLGEGGMGKVCQAVDLRKVEADDEEPNVAIKLLTGDFQQHPNAFISLQREAKKTQALAHPNIITVYDFDRDEGTVFMTMEELDGYPLDAVIKGKTDVTLDLTTAVKIVTEIALALEYAHSKGIIHSDLKPGNIFYTKTGQTKVLDFGIARAINTGLYKDNYDAGELNALTPKYASLEMFNNEAPDPSDDIYALGLIAGELIAGIHPYENKFAPVVHKKKLKPTFKKPIGWLYRRLITRATAVERKHRTKTASDFLSQLQWAVKGPRRILVSSVLLLALIIGNTFLIDAVDTTVKLSDLPLADQEQVLNNIAEADTALKFQDYNGALVYLERAYEIHNSNEDVKDRSQQILETFQQQFNQADSEQQRFLKEQLSAMSEYPFIAKSEKYQELLKDIK